MRVVRPLAITRFLAIVCITCDLIVSKRRNQPTPLPHNTYLIPLIQHLPMPSVRPVAVARFFTLTTVTFCARCWITSSSTENMAAMMSRWRHEYVRCASLLRHGYAGWRQEVVIHVCLVKYPFVCMLGVSGESGTNDELNKSVKAI